jgi:prevent-host-death family protein
MSVNVRELKAHLSEYLRRVQRGEEIVVTSRGKEVGRLLGPRRASPDPQDAAVARLRAQPWVRPATAGRFTVPDRPLPVAPGTSEQVLDWVRGD